jgi:hypothetical protein
MRREAYRKPSGIGTTPPSAELDWHIVLDLEVSEVPASVGILQSRWTSSRNPEPCQWLYLKLAVSTPMDGACSGGKVFQCFFSHKSYLLE